MDGSWWSTEPHICAPAFVLRDPAHIALQSTAAAPDVAALEHRLQQQEQSLAALLREKSQWQQQEASWRHDMQVLRQEQGPEKGMRVQG